VSKFALFTKPAIMTQEDKTLEEQVLTVMYYQICPKCYGSGKIYRPLYNPGDSLLLDSTNGSYWVCDVCNGLKMIVAPSIFQLQSRIKELEAVVKEYREACEQLINAPHQEHFAARLNDEEMTGIIMITNIIRNS
jgi:hypothetical protein